MGEFVGRFVVDVWSKTKTKRGGEGTGQSKDWRLLSWGWSYSTSTPRSWRCMWCRYVVKPGQCAVLFGLRLRWCLERSDGPGSTDDVLSYGFSSLLADEARVVGVVVQEREL